MKKALLAICILLLLSTYLFSQSEKDAAIYKRGLVLLDKAKTPKQFLTSAAYFETLAIEHPDHWLATYYAGLSYILAAKNSEAGENTGNFLDTAQVFIDKSMALKPDEPEIQILQAFLYQIRLTTDSQGRAINFAQKAESQLKKAIASDSSNPRAYFLMANNVYHTPPVFKGGPKNALPVFLRAKEKFRMYKPQLSFSPSWGEDENEEMIKICSLPKS